MMAILCKAHEPDSSNLKADYTGQLAYSTGLHLWNLRLPDRKKKCQQLACTIE